MKELINKYSMFIKYIIVSCLSFIIDISFFNIFNFIFKSLDYRIIISTILARIISSLINFMLNKDKVFKSNESTKVTIVKYYTLVIVQMLISAFVVNKLYKVLSINENFIKIPVEIILFICNYLIQKVLIFKRGNNEKVN